MRFGLYSLSLIIVLICFVILNTTNIPPETIDTTFESIDSNSFSNPDVNFSSDANLSKAIGLIGSGIVKEFHGTYYLASWINPFLPQWLLENKDVLIWVIALLIFAPLLAVILHFGILFLLALLMIIWERIKKRRKNKCKK